jgi:hypothetical protein
MIKNIVSVATELDGHAFSETFYLETTEKMTTDKIIDIVFYEAKKENELQIKHIKNNKVWGDIYGFTFALEWRELEDIKQNKLYYLSSRTG